MTLAKGDKLAKVKLSWHPSLPQGEAAYQMVTGEAYHIWEIVELSSVYGSATEVFQIVVLKKVE